MPIMLYCADCETTGLNYIKHSPVEISIYRLNTDEQKTWFLKPINFEHISMEALKVNGIKLEDLKGQTAEGREKYQDPKKVIVEIENWLMEDMASAEDRVLIGQNVGFDKEMLISLWEKCESPDTFPFSPKREFNTDQLEIAFDYATDKLEDSKGYSLKLLNKKYGIVNKAAHTAEADVQATVELFRKQMKYLKTQLAK